MAVDIQSLKETISFRNLRWCSTYDQLADAFTKIGGVDLYARLEAGTLALRNAEASP